MRKDVFCKLRGPIECSPTIFVCAEMGLEFGRKARRSRGGQWSQRIVAYRIAPGIETRVVIGTKVELLRICTRFRLIQAGLFQ